MLNGKLSAFGYFVREHRPGLEQMASMLCSGSGIDPEDLVGETLERALHAFEQLSEGEADTVNAWLSNTLSRCFMEQCHRRGTDVKLSRPHVAQEPVKDAPSLPRSEHQDVIDTMRTRFRELYAQPASGRRSGTLGGSGTGWLM